jgi:hypothetical protein
VYNLLTNFCTPVALIRLFKMYLKQTYCKSPQRWSETWKYFIVTAIQLCFRICDGSEITQRHSAGLWTE